MKVEVHYETPGDEAVIRRIHALAFGGDAEGALVDRLRDAHDLVVSLTAVVDGRIVGHLAFSRLHISSGIPEVAVSLAPISVMPDHQSRGFGTAFHIAQVVARLRFDERGGKFACSIDDAGQDGFALFGRTTEPHRATPQHHRGDIRFKGQLAAEFLGGDQSVRRRSSQSARLGSVIPCSSNQPRSRSRPRRAASR